LKPEDWEKAYALVLKSVLKLTQLVIPAMQKTGWGRLVFITSLSAKQPITNIASSSTFRAGLLGFAKALSNDVGKFGITANTVLPGYTLTDRQKELARIAAEKTDKSPEEIIKGWEAGIPLGRTARPEEIAAAVVFLASEKASYITGTILPVDGGRIAAI
jgi:3-oxoacyl-[acyl-carrier protein] reductase